MKQTKQAINIGISSIVTVFIFICIIIFASLSLVSANADYSLSKKYADHVSEYYTACNQVEEWKHTITQELNSALEASVSQDDYISQSYEALTKMDFITVKNDGDVLLLEGETAISDSQILQFSMRVVYPKDSDLELLQVTKWQAVPAKEWEGDNHITVLGGES